LENLKWQDEGHLKIFFTF